MPKMTIGNKMLLSAGALMATSAMLGLTSFIGLSNIGDRLHQALGPGLKNDVLALHMQSTSANLLSLGRGELVRGYIHDVPSAENDHRQFAASVESFEADLSTLDGMEARPEAKEAIAEMRTALASLVDAEEGVDEAVAAGDMTKAFALYDAKMLAADQATAPAFETLLRVEAEGIEQNAQEADSAIATTRLIGGIALLVCFGLGVAILFTVRGTNRDLISGVAELAGSIGQIASAASQVASSSQAMAQGASEQAATIEETSSASAEINSMAHRNTENSRSTAQIVTGAQVRTEQTNSSLTEMVEAMDGITSSSQKISKIIKVIDEIAFQTNILALNAAVEAARAGDAGMGFAVVADEVRSLAQRSAQAAKDTAGLIEESILRSNGGKTKVDQVASGIHTVTKETAKIKVLVDEINLGSVEQSRGIDQISRSITEMEHVTQSNAASAQESAAAAAQLSSQAQGMRAVVERLSEMVGTSHGMVSASLPVSVSARPAVGSAPRPRKALPARPAIRPVAKASPLRRPAMATAGPSFPMDDDFKEF